MRQIFSYLFILHVAKQSIHYASKDIGVNPQSSTYISHSRLCSAPQPRKKKKEVELLINHCFLSYTLRYSSTSENATCILPPYLSCLLRNADFSISRNPLFHQNAHFLKFFLPLSYTSLPSSEKALTPTQGTIC